MTDRKLHHTAYSEWREDAADEYVQAQRRAFIDGFETAAKESEQFTLLRDWLEEERDKSMQRYEDHEEITDFTRRMVLIEVLVKLSEIGCHPSEDGEDDG